MTERSLFEGQTGPGSQVADTDNYTMGVEFYVTETGCTLTKIRFWAAATVTGSDHAVRLYQVTSSSTGTLIAGSSKALPSPLQAGWNVATLDAPIALAQNVPYLACVYFTTNDGYTATGNYWWSGGPGSGGLTNGPLSAPSFGTQSGPGQGAFNAGADAFPNGAFNGGNYWVDPVIDDGEVSGVTGVLSGSLPALTGTLAGIVQGAVTGVLDGNLPALSGTLTGNVVGAPITGYLTPGAGSAVPGAGVPGEMVPGSYGAGNLPALTGSIQGTTGLPGLSGFLAGVLPGLQGSIQGTVENPPSSSPDPESIVFPAGNPVELWVNRLNTAAFIAADPVSVALQVRGSSRTPSGAYAPERQSERPLQTFKLIMQSPAGSSIEQRTGDGTERQVDYILLGPWDAQIAVGDYWDDGGQRWEVKAIVPRNGYETRAVVEAHGKDLIGG